MIFFARKAGGRDSFIGHGVIQEVLLSKDLGNEERKICEKMGWKRKILLGETVARYAVPLPVKDILGEDSPRGNRLHGYPLTRGQVAEILSNLNV